MNTHFYTPLARIITIVAMLSACTDTHPETSTRKDAISPVEAPRPESIVFAFQKQKDPKKIAQTAASRSPLRSSKTPPPNPISSRESCASPPTSGF